MERTVTVKGEGSISRKPDQAVLDLNLEELDEDYGRAMARAAEDLNRLKQALEPSGFSQDLKTSQFSVTTQYRSDTDPEGRYLQVFDGYLVRHALKLELDFDRQVLAEVISLITGTDTKPRIDIRFGVKDQAQVSEELLKSASQNARRRAAVLAEASGVSLGRLLRIDYNWSDVRFFSDTSYQMQDEKLFKSAVPEFEPADISLKDSAVFVWEMA